MIDLIIRGGTIIDGRGRSPFKGEIAVKGEKISSIKQYINEKGRREINAKGLIVSPGFIDIHNHPDISLLIQPQMKYELYQGVTTVVGGNCGFSLVPAGKMARDTMFGIASLNGMDTQWKSMEEYLNALNSLDIGINFATQIGHGTVRAQIMGFQRRPPTSGELKEMGKEVEIAIKQGAFGLSTGLEYIPGRFAETKELIALAQVASQNKAFYSSHTRAQDASSACEAIDIAKQANISVQISHLKKKDHEKILSLIDRAERQGLNINYDLYPYTFASTAIQSFVKPEGFIKGGEVLSEQAKKEMGQNNVFLIEDISRKEAEGIYLCSALHTTQLVGKTILQIAEELACSCQQAIAQILVENKMDAWVIEPYSGYDTEIPDIMIQHPKGMFGSDSVHIPRSKESKDMSHPRSFGTFPRILRKYVREKKLLSIEEAVRKMTSMPARKIGLSDRGVLDSGYAAALLSQR